MSDLNVLLLRRRKIGYCLLYAGDATGAWQNESCSENSHLFDDIEPAALENKSLDEERYDNIEPDCELACESDSGEDERFRRRSDKYGRLGENVKFVLLTSMSKSSVD